MNKPADLQLDTVPVWIGGKRVSSANRFGDVYNPATGQVTKRVVFADSKLVDSAVSAAAAAFPGMARHAAAASGAGHAGIPVFTEKKPEAAC